MSFQINHEVLEQGDQCFSRKYGKDVPETLKLLSYNIQAAIGTSSYHHYVTRSWRHLLPDWRGVRRLDLIARRMVYYQLV